MGAALPAYLQVVSMTAQLFLTYRAALVLQLVVMLLQVFLLKMVWTAVYGGRVEVESVELRTVIAYLTLANLQFWLVAPVLGNFIPEHIRAGQIALELARPLPYVRQMFMRQLGATAALVPFVLVALPFALLVGGLAPPASASAGLLYLVSLCLAFGVVTLWGLVLGLAAFWTIEVWGFIAIRYFVAQFFGGALVPLAFFPDWLRTLGGLLPFQAELHIPMSIYFGQMSGPEAARRLLVQLFWLIVLGAAAGLMWRHALRRVVIQGG